jgi:hypothetical protein
VRGAVRVDGVVRGAVRVDGVVRGAVRVDGVVRVEDGRDDGLVRVEDGLEDGLVRVEEERLEERVLLLRPEDLVDLSSFFSPDRARSKGSSSESEA